MIFLDRQLTPTPRATTRLIASEQPNSIAILVSGSLDNNKSLTLSLVPDPFSLNTHGISANSALSLKDGSNTFAFGAVAKAADGTTATPGDFSAIANFSLSYE